MLRDRLPGFDVDSKEFDYFATAGSWFTIGMGVTILLLVMAFVLALMGVEFIPCT